MSNKIIEIDGRFVEGDRTLDRDRYDDGTFIDVLGYRIATYRENDYHYHKYLILRQQKHTVWKTEYTDDALHLAGDGGLQWGKTSVQPKSIAHIDTRLAVYCQTTGRFLKETIPIKVEDMEEELLNEDPDDPFVVIKEEKRQEYKNGLEQLIKKYDRELIKLEDNLEVYR